MGLDLLNSAKSIEEKIIDRLDSEFKFQYFIGNIIKMKTKKHITIISFTD